MTQIKVEHTKQHQIRKHCQYPDDCQYPLGCHKSCGQPKETLVTEGKLVLVPAINTDKVILFKEKNGVFHVDKISLDRPYSMWKPIIISETEKIEVGDAWFNIKNPDFIHYSATEQEVLIINNQYKESCKKILTLPEHFSPKHLRAIVDGKLKDGDKVLIECEIQTIKMDYKGVDSRGDYKWFCPKCGKGGSYMGTGDVHCYDSNCVDKVIKLNSQFHITLHKVEEKMYTREGVREIITEAIKDCEREELDWHESGVYTNLNNWFEQNVK